MALGQGVESPIVGCSTPERVDDAVAALDVALTADELDYLEEPYRAHELVGPKPRPGEKPLAGTTKVNLTKWRRGGAATRGPALALSGRP